MTALEQTFAHGDSFIHSINPRIRLLCSGLLAIPFALLDSVDQALFSMFTGILLGSMAQLPFYQVVNRLLTVNLFILFLWIFLPFSTPGNQIASIGPLTATDAGLKLATLISLKSNAIVLTVITLIGTIKVQDLGPALQCLKVPTKLCHILLFTYRYIFVIHQEYKTMRQAMTARGFHPRTDRHTYQTYAWLVGMLLIKSWDRAERVHDAMLCRGFRGRFYSLTTFTTARRDYLFLTFCLFLAATPFCLNTVCRGFI